MDRELVLEAAGAVSHAEREIAEFDTLIACATGAGSAREVLIRERIKWVQERDRASEILASLSPSFAALTGN